MLSTFHKVKNKFSPVEKAYANELSYALSSFDKTVEWLDLVKSLKKLNKILIKYKSYYNSKSKKELLLPEITIITKRLAQCLEASLPSGVHIKTLEAYKTLFSLIGPDNLVVNLSLYTVGLFPLLSYGSTRVIDDLLYIYETYFLPLENKLDPSLDGFVYALMPGMKEPHSDLFNKIKKILDELAVKVNKKHFVEAIWRCGIICDKERLSIINFINKVFEMSNEETIEMYSSTNLSLCLKTLLCCINDNNILVQRGMLGFIIKYYPLNYSSFSLNQDLKLVGGILPVLINKDSTINKKIYIWMFGTHVNTKENLMEDSTLFIITENILELLQIKKHFNKTKDFTLPIKILNLLFTDRSEISTSFLFENIFEKLLHYIYDCHSYLPKQASDEVISASMEFYNNVSLLRIWDNLNTLVINHMIKETKFINTRNYTNLFYKIKFLLETFNLIKKEKLISLQFAKLIGNVFKRIHLDPFCSTYLLFSFEFCVSMLKILNDVDLLQEEDIKIFLDKTSYTLPKKIELNNFQVKLLRYKLTLIKMLTEQLLNRDIHLFKNYLLDLYKYSLKYVHNSSPFISFFGIKIYLYLIQRYDSLDNNKDNIKEILNKLWDYYNLEFSFLHNKVTKKILIINEIDSKICSDIIADKVKRSTLNDITDGYSKFASFWSNLNHLPDNKIVAKRALFLMIDAIEDSRPLIKLVIGFWIRNSLKSINRIFYPLLYTISHSSVLFTSDSDIYNIPFDFQRIKYIFKSISNIINKDPNIFMRYAFKKISSEFILTLFNERYKHSNNLLEYIVYIGIDFIKGKSNPKWDKKDIINCIELRENSAEFIKSIIKHIPKEKMENIYSILLKKLLKELAIAVKNYNWSMQTPLIILIKGIIMDEYSNVSKSMNVMYKRSEFIKIIINGIKNSNTNTDYQLDSPKLTDLFSKNLSSLAHFQPLSNNPNSHQQNLPITPNSHSHHRFSKILLTSISINLNINLSKPQFKDKSSYNIFDLLKRSKESKKHHRSIDGLLNNWLWLTISSLPIIRNFMSSDILIIIDCLCQEIIYSKEPKNIFTLLNALRYSFTETICNENTDKNEFQKEISNNYPLNIDSINLKSFPIDKILSSKFENHLNIIKGNLVHVLYFLIPRIVCALCYSWDSKENLVYLNDESKVLSSLGGRLSSINHLNLRGKIEFEIKNILNPAIEQHPVYTVKGIGEAWEQALFLSFPYLYTDKDETKKIEYIHLHSLMMNMLNSMDAFSPDKIIPIVINLIVINYNGNKSKTNDTNPPKSEIHNNSLLHMLDIFIRMSKKEGDIQLMWSSVKILVKNTVELISDGMCYLWLLDILYIFILKYKSSLISSSNLKSLQEEIFIFLKNILVLISSKSKKFHVSEKSELIPIILYHKVVADKEDDKIISSWVLSVSKKIDFMPSTSTSKISFDDLSVIALRIFSNVLPSLIYEVWGKSDKINTILTNIIMQISPVLSMPSVKDLDKKDASINLIYNLSIISAKNRRILKVEVINCIQKNDFFMTNELCLVKWKVTLNLILQEYKSMLQDLIKNTPVSSLFISKENEILERSSLIKRIAFTIISGDKDVFKPNLPTIIEKLVESMKIPNAVNLYCQVFLCFRVLLIRFSSEYLKWTWPMILMEVIRTLENSSEMSWILDVCKFIDLAFILYPEQFYLYHWCFIYNIDNLKKNNSSQNNKKSVEFESHLTKLIKKLYNQETTENNINNTKSPSHAMRKANSNYNLKKLSLIIQDSSKCNAETLINFHDKFSKSIHSNFDIDKKPDYDFIEKTIIRDFTSVDYLKF